MYPILEVNPCLSGSHNCSQICNTLDDFGYDCSCKPGFYLEDDGYSCGGILYSRI